MKFDNPYKRLEEIKERIKKLEWKQESLEFFGAKKGKSKVKLEDIKSEIMFLVFEQLSIEDAVKYFEKQLKKKEQEEK